MAEDQSFQDWLEDYKKQKLMSIHSPQSNEDVGDALLQEPSVPLAPGPNTISTDSSELRPGASTQEQMQHIAEIDARNNSPRTLNPTKLPSGSLESTSNDGMSKDPMDMSNLPGQILPTQPNGIAGTMDMVRGREPAPNKTLSSTENKDQNNDDTDEEQIETPAARSNKQEVKQTIQTPTEQTPLSREDLLAQLVAAQQEQKKQLAAAMIQRGGAQMLGGATRTAPDYTNANIIEKQAAIPIQNLQQKIGVSEEQTKLNDAQEMADPKSQTSQMLRDFAKRFGMNVPDTASGKHIQMIAPMIVKAFESEENRKSREDVAEQNRLSREFIYGNKSDAATTKSQDSAYLKAISAANTSRLPPDVKQAKVDQYLASKAKLIFDKYPNLNDISEAQKNQLLSELGKIAQGGVPGVHELKGLDPNTWDQVTQKFLSRVTGVPRGANVGEFLQQQKEYLSDLNNNASQVVNRFHQNLYDQYEDVIGEKHAAKLKKTFKLGDNAPIQRQPQSMGYSPQQESGIAKVMKDHKLSREDAIKELQQLKVLQ